MISTKCARAIAACALAFTALTLSSGTQAADPPMKPTAMNIMTVNCEAKGYNTYTLQQGDTCLSLASDARFHFASFRQVEKINKPLSGFTCAAARKGQIICYPRQ